MKTPTDEISLSSVIDISVYIYERKSGKQLRLPIPFSNRLFVLVVNIDKRQTYNGFTFWKVSKWQIKDETDK